MRRFLSAMVLLVGLPLYIIAAMYLISLFERPPFLLELLIYIVLGILWALPFRKLFRGVGKSDPDAVNPRSSEAD
jgi:branched-subunit amino acid transport protein